VTPEVPSAVLLTVDEAAERLRVGRSTMYSLIRSGAVDSVKIGSLRRVPAEALPEFVTGLLSATRSTATAA
jgi:excisionase family DNA binding protein